MPKFWRLCVVAATILALIDAGQCRVASAATVLGPTTATKVIFYNGSNADTAVLVTIGANGPGNAKIQDGCPLSIGSVQYLDLTAGTGAAPLTAFGGSTVGWFPLKRGHQVQLINQAVDPYTKQQNYCLDGVNIGFGGLGAAQCPLTPGPAPNTNSGSQFNQTVNVTSPNGTNGFELTLNLPGKTTTGGVPAYSAAQESIDLTCEAGAAWLIQIQVTPPVGGPYWTYNAGPRGGGNISYTSTLVSQNSWVRIGQHNGVPDGTGCDDNCLDPKTGLPRPGVFPYGCSACNIFPDPKPQCSPVNNPHGPANLKGQFCAVQNGLPANNGCQLNRGALNNSTTQTSIQKFGGTIQVNFLGPISPPTKCP